METPSTNDDWTIHSLNIHGIFFQKLIASLIDENNHIKLVSTEYPVEFPDSYKARRGEESRLDIHARLWSPVNPQTTIDLLIECKKANPEFIDWIFFPRIAEPNFRNNICFLKSYFVPIESDPWNVEYGVISRPFSHVKNAIDTADEARETRGTYPKGDKGAKTKTSNAAISDASYQIVLATHAIASKISRIDALHGEYTNTYPYRISIYLPIIVTTANLFLCSFNPLDTTIETGEIAHSKVDLKPVDRLFYEYPVPPHLQIKTNESPTLGNYPSLESGSVRRHILVVNSKKFEETLNWLHNNAEYIIGG